MKYILLESLWGVGKKGDIIDMKVGAARRFGSSLRRVAVRRGSASNAKKRAGVKSVARDCKVRK